jgi:hypothetical protein
MKQNINEIELNGVVYVPKSSIQEDVKTGPYSIVRCESAGVFFGQVVSHDPQTGIATIKDCRRLWYWAGAASLSQLAVDGTSKPGECKFPVATPCQMVAKVIEMIPVTEKAAETINSTTIWKA